MKLSSKILLTITAFGMSSSALVLAGSPAQAVEQSYLDGATGYVHEYSITGISSNISPRAVQNLMVNRFDVVFPFEPQGCGVPLKVGSVCTLGAPKFAKSLVPNELKDWINGKSKVRVQHIGSDGFTFLSMPGHAEGANRQITFTAFRDGSGIMTLRVHARGPGDSPLWKTPQTIAANFVLTKALWSDFRNRLKKELQSANGGGSW